MSFTRRHWFQVAGAGLSTLMTQRMDAARNSLFVTRAADAPELKTMTTACGICSPACGMKVTLENNVVRFVEGIPGDTSGKGHLCGKGAAAAGFLYDPDRLKYPMKRTNPNKGLNEDPGWVRITWQEALDTIAEKIDTARKDYGNESLLFVTLPAPDMWARFMNSIGVINRIDHIDECFLTDRIVQKYTTGAKTWCNDFENSKYILLFGWDILAKTKIVYATGIVEAKEKGAKVVVFNPQYSTTARFADEWHPIRPGSDLAVALAMIHVILRDNTFDRAFVSSFTNFAQYETEIRKHFEQYTPQWASQLSDIPVTAIEKVARDFATMGPAVAPAHKKTLAANYINATQLSHAISILNILAGTIDRPGGRFFPRSVSIPGVDAIYPPPAYPPKTGRRVDGKEKLPLVLEDGGGMFSTLADGMLKQYPDMIQFAFFNAYTILGFPEPLKMEEALKKVPFLVVMDVLPTDTAQLADIVLPSAMYMEVNDVVGRDYNARYQQVVARRAVSAPIFEARGAAYVALELGRRLSPDYFKMPDGNFINNNTLLDEKTKRAGLADNFAAFVEKGGNFTNEQPFTPRTTFATPAGKCQIFVPEFAARGGEALPSWKQKREVPTAEYPYYYLTFIPGVHKRNSTQNNGILNEMFPTNSVIIPRALAVQKGIREGDLVHVRSRAGGFVLPAHLTETLRPDCVLVAHGFGHRSALLSRASGSGVRDGDLISGQPMTENVKALNFGGAAGIMEAVVNIEKA